MCFAPVLSLAEAPAHPHNAARGTFVDIGGALQPAPAPRYAMRPLPAPIAARRAGEDTDAVLASIGYDGERIVALRDAGVIA